MANRTGLIVLAIVAAFMAQAFAWQNVDAYQKRAAWERDFNSAVQQAREEKARAAESWDHIGHKPAN